jgi:hypothetical protein
MGEGPGQTKLFQAHKFIFQTSGTSNMLFISVYLFVLSSCAGIYMKDVHRHVFTGYGAGGVRK